MVATSLIKETPEQLELFRQMYPADANGIHQVSYGLTASNFNNGDLAAGLGTPPTVIPASVEEQAFIASVFRELASLIPIQGIQNNSLSSPLQIVSVDRVRDDASNPLTSGITYTFFRYRPSSGVKTLLPRPDSYITIEAELNDDPGLSNSEKRTIVHEIGHALGLEHAGGNPDDPAYTDLDTIMSYNIGGSTPSYRFTAADRQALVEMWGSANSTNVRIDAVTGQVIEGFSSGTNRIVLNAGLPGLKSLAMRTVSGSRKVLNKKGLMSRAPLVYWQTEGELYLNSNGKLKGVGSGGGLLADFGPFTALNASDLTLG